MDAESSSKFIGSLTKFLQSLCNGYVDFEDGVELIGHIYLSVDTGKKIDYILNEKVCKSDNSVTFISNSFHAQPLDKLKTISSKKTAEDKTPDGTGRKEEEALLLESGDGPTRNTQINTTLGRNHGSLSSGQVTQNRSSVKRPGSPLTPRKAPTPPQRRPSTPPSQRRSQLQSASAKGSLESPASLKNVPSSPSSSSLDNAPSPSSRLKTNHPSTETVSGDADSDILVPPNILAVAHVPDLSSFLGATANEGQDATAHEQGLATSDDETKPDTDITFIKEEFIPSASSCAQAGSSGQSSGRSMEEQVHDSGSSSGLYPVMLHQNTAAFSNSGGVFPPSFPSLGNATATSTSTSQASTDIFANPVPGTSNQDSSSGDPSVSLRTRTVANPSTLNIKIEPEQSEGSESSQSSVFQVSDVAWAASTALSSLTSGSAQLLPASGDINQYVPSQSSFLAPDAWATHSHMTAGLTNRLSFSGAPSDLEPSLGFSLPVPHKSNAKGKSKPHRYTEETGDVEQAPEKPYKCPKCGMRYAQTCSLGRHRKKCEGRSGLTCIFCGRVFHRKDKYREHLLARHQYVDKELGPPGYTLAPKQI